MLIFLVLKSENFCSVLNKILALTWKRKGNKEKMQLVSVLIANQNIKGTRRTSRYCITSAAISK